MAKVKLTKNELKKQKDELKRFNRYLPTLILKKQQLQMVIRQVDEKEKAMEAKRAAEYELLMSWVGVYAEAEKLNVSLNDYIKIEAIERETGNIAGVDIPIFKGLRFEDLKYDIFILPLWVDQGIVMLKMIAALDAEVEVLKEQRRLLSLELRITTQRVNLFEKIKIPDARNNIRMIRIYLGDEQTAAVVRGKMSKKKMEKVS